MKRPVAASAAADAAEKAPHAIPSHTRRVTRGELSSGSRELTFAAGAAAVVVFPARFTEGAGGGAGLGGTAGTVGATRGAGATGPGAPGAVDAGTPGVAAGPGVGAAGGVGTPGAPGT